MQYLGLVDDEYDEQYDDDYYDAYEEPVEPERPVRHPATGPVPRPVPAPGDAGAGVNVVRRLPQEPPGGDVPSVRPMAVGPSSARVHVMEPTGFNDAQEVGDRLKANQPVILNLQGVDRDLQRRLIDFSSGLAYALGGRMSKAADQVFLLTPSNVSVTEEEKDRLEAEGLYRR
jgi:cell division inhibitor SepF